MFHSSLPLRLMEFTMESSGSVEIEGLDGTVSTGFSADEFRFKTLGDNWSKLEGINFKYENDWSFFGTDSLTITEMSIDSGVIYAQWDPAHQQIDIESLEVEFDDMKEGIDFQENQSDVAIAQVLADLKIRLDKISIANLKIVNPQTEDELVIENVSYEGFKLNEGVFEDLGELTVNSTQLDVETVEPQFLTEHDNARRLQGTIHKLMDNRLVADIPFVVEYAIDEDLNGFTKVDLFDGAMKIEDTSDQLAINYSDFSTEAYFDKSQIPVLPTNINMQIEFEQGRNTGPSEVNTEGQFTIGETTFTNLRISESPKGRQYVVGSGEIAEQSITAKFFISSPYSPWINMQLKSDGDDKQEELWAQTLFGKAFDDLNDREKTSIESVIPKKKKTVNKPTGESQDEFEDSEDVVEESITSGS